jgi:hypothetical protein
VVCRETGFRFCFRCLRLSLSWLLLLLLLSREAVAGRLLRGGGLLLAAAGGRVMRPAIDLKKSLKNQIEDPKKILCKKN